MQPTEAMHTDRQRPIGNFCSQCMPTDGKISACLLTSPCLPNLPTGDPYFYVDLSALESPSPAPSPSFGPSPAPSPTVPAPAPSPTPAPPPFKPEPSSCTITIQVARLTSYYTWTVSEARVRDPAVNVQLKRGWYGVAIWCLCFIHSRGQLVAVFLRLL